MRKINDFFQNEGYLRKFRHSSCRFFCVGSEKATAADIILGRVDSYLIGFVQGSDQVEDALPLDYVVFGFQNPFFRLTPFPEDFFRGEGDYS